MSIELFSEERSISLEKDEIEIKKIINDMLEFTKNLIVNDEKNFITATNLYKQARDWKKIIEEKRKLAIEPDRKRISIINDKAHELSEPLDIIIELTNKMSSNYKIFLENKKREENEKILNASDIFDFSNEIYISELEKNLKGEGAISITKQIKKFRLIDLDKVPKKYLMLDENKIKSDLKLGIKEIPGLEIFEEKITQLRAR